MENQNNTLAVDKELVTKMVRYILSRPAAEVLGLVNEMVSKGLLVNQPVASAPVQEAAPAAQ